MTLLILSSLLVILVIWKFVFPWQFVDGIGSYNCFGRNVQGETQIQRNIRYHKEVENILRIK